jgi:error-prone DNA polymerase
VGTAKAAFLAGVLTHDPGMYPKRLILDDARNLGITVLPLDVNSSDGSYRVELLPVDDPLPPGWEVGTSGPGTSGGAGSSRDPDHPDGRGYGIRLSLAEVKGISEAEVSRLVAARPYHSLNDLWQRAEISRPVAERLIVAGGLDSLYGLGERPAVRARGGITRRDLLLTLAELDRWSGRPSRRVPGQGRARAATTAVAGGPAAQGAAEPVGRSGLAVRDAAAGQSRAARPVPDGRLQPVQLAFDLAAAAEQTFRSGLEEMTSAERVQAELEVLGLDASRHVLDFYRPLLEALEVTWARQLRQRRNRAELLVAGVKVATQTPPVRSGRRVVFLTLDDSTGPVDATFFEDAQGPYAGTVFHSWLLLVRGVLRRTGPRGVSLRATGAWELPQLWDVWSGSGLAAVHDVLADGWVEALSGAGRADRPGAAGGLSRVAGIGRDDGLVPGLAPDQDWEAATGLPAGDRAVAGRPGGSGDEGAARAGGMGGGRRPRRVLVHPSGFRQSPYADLQAAGDDVRDTRSMLTTEQSGGRPELKRRGDPAPRKLWHSSPGSSGP